MKLGRRLAIAIVTIVFAVLGLQGWLAFDRERALLVRDMRRDQVVAARAIAAGLAEELRDGESPDELLAEATANGSGMTFRWWSDGTSIADLPLGPDGISRLKAGDPVFVRVAREGPEAHDDAWTLFRVAGRGVLGVRESLEETDDHAQLSAAHSLGAAILLAALSSALILGIGARMVGRRVQLLVEHVQAVGAGDLAARCGPLGDDELGDLARELDAMTAQLERTRSELSGEVQRRIQALQELRHADRLTTVGKLAAGLAHELGTPLNVVHGHGRILQTIPDVAPPVANGARVIVEQAERMTALVRRLLDFARRRAPSKERLELGAQVRRSVELLAAMARREGVTMEVVTPDETITVGADPAGLQQVVTNLVLNAIQASPAGGSVRVLTSTRHVDEPPPIAPDAPPGDYAVVAVEDEGPGVPEELRERIFEPFFTTKDVGRGTGLGLSVALGIAQDHAGWIEVHDAPGGGARLEVLLPQAARSSSASIPSPLSRSAASPSM